MVRLRLICTSRSRTERFPCEPYDYIERDLEAAVPVDVALAIADGKTTIKEAVENGSLYVFGNVQFALKFAKLFD